MTDRIFIPELLGGIDDALLFECDELITSISKKSAQHRKNRFAFILAAATISVFVVIASVILIMNREDIFTPDPPDTTVTPGDLESQGFVIRDGVLISYTGSATEIVIPDGVVKIGADAFSKNTTVRVLTLSSSVSEIESTSLTSCESLVEVRVAENGKIKQENGLVLSSDGTSIIFVNKAKLNGKLEIPEGVTEIPEGAFRYCLGFTSVKLPSTMENVGEWAFEDCDELVELSLGGTKTVGEGAFRGCELLATVDFGAARIIGKEAFANCDSLENVVFNDVRTVQTEAFRMSGVKTLDLGKTAATIQKLAFSDCNISTLYIPVSLNSVTQDAFISNNIKTVYYRGNETQWKALGTKYRFLELYYSGYELIFLNEISESSNYSFKFESNGDGSCTAIPENVRTIEGAVAVPERSPAGDTVTSIGVFRNATMLTEIYLPKSVTSIPEKAFYGCASLSKVDMAGVTSLGESAFYGCLMLENIELGEGVTVIPANAFYGCGLKEIVLSSSITKIGDGAFSSNKSLKRADLSATKLRELVNAFSYCEALCEVILPETLETVGTNTFSSCRALSSISLPSSVKRIGDQAFASCVKLEALVLPAGLETLEGSPFTFAGIRSLTIPASVNDYGLCFMYTSALESVEFEKTPEYINGFEGSGIERFVVPEGVKSISARAFYDCKKLKEIVIAESVETIGYGAFANCTSLESVKLPAAIQSIGNRAFYECKSLKEAVLPSGLTEIAQGLFSGCASLEGINIPEGVTSVGQNAFKDCASLSAIQLPTGVTSIGSEAFSGCTSLKEFICDGVEFLPDKCFYNCGLEVFKIPASVKTIGESCFEDSELLRELTFSDNIESIGKRVFAECFALESVVMAGTVTELPEEAFYFCINLKNVVFSPKLNVIGNNCFQHCRALEGITIPASVESINRYAFDNCSSLKDLVLNEGVKNIEEFAFRNCAIVELRIPSSVKQICNDAFWTMNYSTLETLTLAKSSATFHSAFRRLGKLKTVIIEDPTDMEFSDTFRGCGSLERVEILNGMMSVGAETFEKCRSLSEIDFSKINKIEAAAFAGCSSLPSEIIFSENIERIEKNSFEDCTSIERVVFPEYFEYVGTEAFKGCTSLREVKTGISLSLSPDSITGCTAFEKIIYPGSEEMFNAFFSLKSSHTQSMLESVEKEYLDSFALPEEYTRLGEFGRFNCKTTVCIDLIDPVNLVIGEYLTRPTCGLDENDRYPVYILATGEKFSLAYFRGIWVLVQNAHLENE